MRFTIDYPRIEMHPFDTKRFTVYYDPTDTHVDAVYNLNKCLHLEALSRQSRDLIALAVKCFSA